MESILKLKIVKLTFLEGNMDSENYINILEISFDETNLIFPN